jgi:hypothetical protein
MDAYTMPLRTEHEPVTLWTPRDAVMAEEDERLRSRAACREERDGVWWGEAFAGVNEGLDWCFCGGAHPAEVLWRFWRLARALRCAEVATYAPLKEAIFWQQDVKGGRFRTALIFPKEDPETADWRIRRTLAPVRAKARQRKHWAAPHAVERLEEFEVEALWSTPGREALRRVYGYLLLKGPEPGRMLRRLYAFTKWLRPELLMEMSLAQLGEIFGGETRAVQGWRVQQMMDGLLGQMGTRGRAKWQRSEATRLRCRDAQLRRRLRPSRLAPEERGQRAA